MEAPDLLIAGDPPVLDVEVLAEASGGDAILERELLARYREYLGADLRAIAEAIELSDAVGARRLAHRVKGAARTVGAQAVAQAAERIELIAADARLSEWHARLRDLRAERDRVEERLGSLAASIHPARRRGAS